MAFRTHAHPIQLLGFPSRDTTAKHRGPSSYYPISTAEKPRSYLSTQWPYDPMSVYMCLCVYLYLHQYSYLCLVSSKALGFEEPEYVLVSVYCYCTTPTTTSRSTTAAITTTTAVTILREGVECRASDSSTKWSTRRHWGGLVGRRSDGVAGPSRLE